MNIEPNLTRVLFAKRCGVPFSEVKAAAQAGKLGLTKDGKVAIDHPLTRLWVISQKQTNEAMRINTSEKEPKTLEKEKLEVDIRLKREQADHAAQRRMTHLGQLLDRDLAVQVFSKISAAMKIHLLDLPARLSPRLHALGKAGSAADIESLLAAEMSKALQAVIKECEVLNEKSR